MTATDQTPEPPTLEEIAAAGTRRKRDEERLKKSSDDLRDLVLAALRDGRYKPTEVTKKSRWSSAYVRKLARAAGIEPDERYKERAERLKKTSSES